MKILTIITLLSFLLTSKTFGQTKTYFKPCKMDEKVFTKCQNPPTFENDIQDLQKYLTRKLIAQISETTGQIKIRFYIDKTGKTCCDWIENISNFDIKKEQLNSIIDTMPNWNPGIQNGRAVDCVLLISLTFNENKLLVEYIKHSTIMGRK